MDIKEILAHPLTAIAVLVSTVGQLGFGVFEPAWSLISATSGLWFPAIATTGATILPEIGYEQLGTSLLLAAAVVFVGVQLDRMVDRVQEWNNNR